MKARIQTKKAINESLIFFPLLQSDSHSTVDGSTKNWNPSSELVNILITAKASGTPVQAYVRPDDDTFRKFLQTQRTCIRVCPPVHHHRSSRWDFKRLSHWEGITHAAYCDSGSEFRHSKRTHNKKRIMKLVNFCVEIAIVPTDVVRAAPTVFPVDGC